MSTIVYNDALPKPTNNLITYQIMRVTKQFPPNAPLRKERQLSQVILTFIYFSYVFLLFTNLP